MEVNVLLTRKFFETDINYIKKGVKGSANIIIPEVYTEEELIKYASEADIFLGPVISKKLCDVAPRLKFIQVPWTGVDNLNFNLIKEIGVKVCNSHSNAYAVAEHAIAMMLDSAKKVSYHDRKMRTGDWNRPKPDKSNKVSPFSKRVSGSKIGIIGYGHIGRQIKKYLESFGCSFYVASLSVNISREEDGVKYYHMDQLDYVLKNVDYLFICVPLTPETRNFFNAEKFSKMRNDAILINISRGEIIDESALHDALVNNKIAGASMDTWYNNPTNPNDIPVPVSIKYPFENFDNIVLSPHRAAMIDGELPHLDDAILNINRTIDELEPLNVVNVYKKY